jgi:hypothetical protein
VCVWSERYEKAWDGRLDKEPAGKPNAKAGPLEQLADVARVGELTVLTDSPRGMELFAGSPRLYGFVEPQPWQRPPALCLIGWFDGEGWSGRQWAVPDWGLWPGGLGAHVLGGVTLIAGTRFPPVLEAFTDGLKGLGFRGLVVVGLDYLEAARELIPTGFMAGWPSIFTHAWMESAGGQLCELLDGQPAMTAPRPFTVALPVTQPPYPVRGAPGPGSVSLAGLVKEQSIHCYFHDVMVEGAEIRTAGINGFVAVVAATGASLHSAQVKALGVAQSLPLPEKQFRMDVGGMVNAALGSLELLGYI